MKIRSILSCLSLLLFASCATSQAPGLVAGTPGPVKAGEATAYFSEGCFWHTEVVFQSLKGVRDAISGYAGGKDANPDYEKVGTGLTGHAETVKVIYDPKVVSYETLVKAFFASQDPTQVNGQGPDEGTQYRSIAFYQNAAEKQAIEREMSSLTASKKYSRPLATQVVGFTKFYPAENYHQEYVIHHPENPYVANVSIRDFEHFRKTFPGNFK